MKQPDGLHSEPEEIKWLSRPEFVWHECGHEGIIDVLFSLEDVLIDPTQMIHCSRLGIDIYWSLHRHVETANLVESECVVDMVVGEENRVTAI